MFEVKKEWLENGQMVFQVRSGEELLFQSANLDAALSFLRDNL